MQKQIVGRLGEDLAVKFLEQKGYLVIARNIKLSYFEIDIIAKIGAKTAFIEVKTKSSESQLWQAEELLSAKKYQAFLRGVQSYCHKNKIALQNVKLEVVAVTLNSNNMTNIKHYLDII